jgi:hypothetical protein
MKNKTRQRPSYPGSILDASLYLRRTITELQDDIVYNADAVNAMLVELERMQQVIGTVENDSQQQLSFQSFFGDGSDGDVTIDTNTTLLRDMYYRNLVVEQGTSINTNGFRVFVRDTLYLNGFMWNPGEDGGDGDAVSAGAGGVGAGHSGSTLGRGKDGGKGEDGTPAVAGIDINGGRGGDGGDGGGLNGELGGATIIGGGIGVENGLADIRNLTKGYHAYNQRIEGGAGGGGGGEDSGTFGGGGGSGGGVIMVAAYRIRTGYNPISSSKQFHAPGGNGGEGGNGGGGGGGGTVIVMSHIIENTNTPPVLASNPLGPIPLGGIMSAPGGNGGFGVFADPGDDGQPGNVYDIRV